MNLKDYWVIEYSAKQDAFHLDTLGTAIQLNKINIERSWDEKYVPTDYLIIGVYSTEEEARKKIEKYKDKRDVYWKKNEENMPEKSQEATEHIDR